MYVGVAIYEVHIAQARSLKDKRAVIRSLRSRIRSRLELSVAEVDHQDLHQRSRIAVAAVSVDGALVEKLLDDVTNILEEDRSTELTGSTREILPFDESVALTPGIEKFES